MGSNNRSYASDIRDILSPTARPRWEDKDFELGGCSVRALEEELRVAGFSEESPATPKKVEEAIAAVNERNAGGAATGGNALTREAHQFYRRDKVFKGFFSKASLKARSLFLKRALTPEDLAELCSVDETAPEGVNVCSANCEHTFVPVKAAIIAHDGSLVENDDGVVYRGSFVCKWVKRSGSFEVEGFCSLQSCRDVVRLYERKDGSKGRLRAQTFAQASEKATFLNERRESRAREREAHFSAYAEEHFSASFAEQLSHKKSRNRNRKQRDQFAY